MPGYPIATTRFSGQLASLSKIRGWPLDCQTSQHTADDLLVEYC
jgi:hypothetical protein